VGIGAKHDSVALSRATSGPERERISALTAGLAATVITWTFAAGFASEKLENSYAGVLGHVIEPVIKPLGFDWKIGIALITSFAAREVFVGTMATIYSVDGDAENSDSEPGCSLTALDATARYHWIALRAHDGITFFRSEALVAGDWQDAGYVDLRGLREQQGEGVAIGPDNTVYLVGEGGGHSRPGTLARLNCSLGQ